MTCDYLLLLPDPDLSLNCWGGNPYCLVLLAVSIKHIGFVDNGLNEVPILQTTHSGTITALLHKKTKGLC